MPHKAMLTVYARADVPSVTRQRMPRPSPKEHADFQRRFSVYEYPHRRLTLHIEMDNLSANGKIETELVRMRRVLPDRFHASLQTCIQRARASGRVLLTRSPVATNCVPLKIAP